MEEYGGGDLLTEAMGSAARVVVIEDCVEAPGAFILHLLLKRALAGGGAAAFLALAQPFAHYDRVLRKMVEQGKVLLQIAFEIQRMVEANKTGGNEGQVTIVVDDISLLEVVAHGSVDDVLDFLHYCLTFTSEMDCSLVILIHKDIYAGEENMDLLLHLRYLADLVVKAAPLSTGLAADVHGQLSVVNKGTFHKQSPKSQKVWNFHFKVKENGADFFYPGSRQ
ncbi:hypothetical protein U9M48_007036 [Paspalum notatum var. saurae]|uniref:Elongator complex protein 6 n=1 Tax=Paspalum notatum var. saurae TaxID=547442 RepID=A0AAQ3PQG0_PASNO